MAFAARLHPLIVHFPIALVVVAAACEATAITSPHPRWRAVAVVNVRVAAIFSVAAGFAGWWLAAAPGIDQTPLLEWHRWLGATAVLFTVGAAITTPAVECSPRRRWIFRAALLCAASFVAAAGHAGGLLVWGADFLRP
jgi:uncharacterized membrane protein